MKLLLITFLSEFKKYLSNLKSIFLDSLDTTAPTHQSLFVTQAAWYWLHLEIYLASIVQLQTVLSFRLVLV